MPYLDNRFQKKGRQNIARFFIKKSYFPLWSVAKFDSVLVVDDSQSHLAYEIGKNKKIKNLIVNFK